MNTKREHGYLLALEGAYNVIFSANLQTQIVECVYGKTTSPIGDIYDIQMTVPSAIKYWVDNYILPEYRDMMRNYFLNITTPGYVVSKGRALQAEFTLQIHSGAQFRYLGVTVPVDDDEILFCCRDISHLIYTPKTYEQIARNPSVPPEALNSMTGCVSHRIEIRTFGFFDIFVDGKAIVFTNPKEKELLALLVDRNGGTVSSDEAMGILWEDEPVDEKLHSRYRKLSMRLKQTLEENGIGGILRSSKGVRSINMDLVSCDYAGLLKGDEQARSSFNDSYMSNYSWAEETLSRLLILTEEKPDSYRSNSLSSFSL